MANKMSTTTWTEDPADVIVLVNHTNHNYILELPTGRCRLDAGRRIRTMDSILKIEGIRALVDEGSLVVEKYDK